MTDYNRPDTESSEAPPAGRGVYCNRTLNLRAIRAVGFDMDYTLVHYHVPEWEGRAYAYVREQLLEQGWPVGDLRFDPELFVRGLVLDTELGNVVMADGWGYVIQASHGTRMLAHDEQRTAYQAVSVDLRDRRWAFMNTLFSISEACIYAQLVDLLDAGELPGALGYESLYAAVRGAINRAHVEGRLKAEIIADPDRFVDLDPELVPTLRDLRGAGKKVIVITNSEWSYTQAMMTYAVERYLPRGARWRDLFDLVVVAARKPLFFQSDNPIFEVVDERSGHLAPVVGELKAGGIYLGGDAQTIEQHLGLSGSQILYVGDHIYADVQVSKRLLRWRTALILRELESDIEATTGFSEGQVELSRLMNEKVAVEARLARARLDVQRGGRAGPMEALKAKLRALDDAVKPLAIEASKLGNARWGLVMRAGAVKSHLARQLERHGDVYTSRVSNFGHVTPYAYLRAPRRLQPHD